MPSGESDSFGMRTASPTPMDHTTLFSIHSRASTSISPYLGSECQSDSDSRSAPEYYSVDISDIDLHHIPTVGWNPLDDRFYLRIFADGNMKETSVASRGSLSWRDKFTFNIHKSCELKFELYARRYVHSDKLMGTVSKRVDKLVTRPDDMVFKAWYGHDPKDDLQRTTLICGITKRELSPEEVTVEATMVQRLCISNIIIHHLPKIKLIALDDHFFVQIEVDGKIACTTDALRGHSLRWKNEYLCDYRNGSRIQLKVSTHRHVHKDQFIYEIDGDVESFLQRGHIREELPGCQIGREHGIPASIEFHIAPSTSTASDTPPDSVFEEAISASSVEITDIRLNYLPKIGKVAFNDQFFVQLGVSGETQSTSSKRQHNGSICWDEKFTFHVPETAFLLLHVYTRRQDDEYIGMVRGEISAFLQGSGCYDRQLVVFNKQGKKNLDTKLSFRINRRSPLHRNSSDPPCLSSMEHSIRGPQQLAGEVAIAAGAIASTSQSLHQSPPAGAILPIVNNATAVFNNTENAFQPLLSRIDTFVRIGRVFSEAHPYTRLAFMVLTAGYEIIQQQHARDESIRQLASTMCESYDLVSDAADLYRFQDQGETITLLARQTIECAYFIRDYAFHKSGSKHCVTNWFSNIDATISSYEAVFKNIRVTLGQKVVIKTQLVVWRLHDALNELAAKVDLNALPYATGASYHAQKSYDDIPIMEDHLTEILDWVNDQSKSSPTIYLLVGPHGPEASAVAHAVARQFDNINRLGSSYCLDRTRVTQKKPTNLFSTIARDLADHDPEFMTCLGNMIKRRAVGSTPHIPTQFNFILSPAQQLTSFGPTLVVIDALDACGDTSSRVDVLSVLKDKAQNLPPSFKLLITCKTETDVATTLRDTAHILHKEFDAVDVEQLCNKGCTAGGTEPRPPTPPIQTDFPHPGYFPLSKSPSSASDKSSSSPSSIAPSIFDGALHTLSPCSEISSPASSITPQMDAGSPKRILSSVKRIEAREESYSLDAEGRWHTVTVTNTKQIVKQRAPSSPQRVPLCAPMLDEPNAHLFISGPTMIPAEDIVSIMPNCDSPRPQRKKKSPIREETIVRSDIQSTGAQSIALLLP